MVRSSPLPTIAVALGLIVAAACGPATDSPPELGTVPREAPVESSAESSANTPAEAEQPMVDNHGIRVGDGAAQKALSEHIERLSEDRLLAREYAAKTLGDALATKRLLLVDPKAPADTREVRFFLLRGAVTTPAKLSALAVAHGDDGKRPRSFLLGGEDAVRPGVFRDIGEGRYTACAVVGPPEDPARKAALERAAAEMEADMKATGKSTAEALKTMNRAGITKPEKIDWDAHPVRCQTVEVTSAADSRVVVLGG